MSESSPSKLTYLLSPLYAPTLYFPARSLLLPKKKKKKKKTQTNTESGGFVCGNLRGDGAGRAVDP